MKGAGDFARQEEAVAACCSKRLLVIVLLASSFLVQHGQATLVKIAVNNDINQYLFYELDVDNPNDIKARQPNANPMKDKQFLQSFNYYIENACLEKILWKYGHYPAERRDLKANLKMYPNHEKTLSFIIEIEFSYDFSLMEDQAGFELIFETEPNVFSCLQISFNSRVITTQSSVKFKLKLKDPQPIRSSKFIFYFGKVFMRRLIKCSTNSNELCAAEEGVVSNRVELGIRTQIGEDMVPYITNEACNNNFPFFEACILRIDQPNKYNARKTDYLIIQPMRPGISEIIADTNLWAFTPEEKKMLYKAGYSQKELITYNGFMYNVSEVLAHSSQGYRVPFYNLRMLERQRHYDLVFKLVREEDKIEYLSSIHAANPSNPCYKEQNTTQNICYCSNDPTKCLPCFKVTDWDKDGIHFVPYRISQTTVRPNGVVYSPSCDKNPYHRLYFDPKLNTHPFANIPIEDFFQNEPLVSPKRSLEEFQAGRYTILNNRDTMPRICMSVEANGKFGYSDLWLMFNDYHQIAQSNLVENSYELRLYQFEFETNMTSSSLTKKDMNKINSVMVLQEPMLIKDLTNMVSIKNLKYGKYFIELRMIQNSNGLCPESDMCIDEAPLKSYECVKCNKLIVRIDLVNKPNTDYCRSTNFGIINKPQSDAREIKIDQIEGLMNYNFQCPVNMDLTDSSAMNDFSLSQLKNKKHLIYSFIAHSKFDMTEMPYIFSTGELNFTIEDCTGYLFYALFGTFLLVSTLAFFSLVYCLYNSYHHNMFCENHRKVIFYVSNFLDDRQQEEMKSFTKKYINLLQDTFQNFEFEVWDYNKETRVERQKKIGNKTLCCCFKFGNDKESLGGEEMRNLVDPERGAMAAAAVNSTSKMLQRRQKLDAADRVIYVCGPTRELDRLGVLCLGQHRFDHEYYLLHTRPVFREKTLSIVFSQVEPRESYKQVPRQTNDLFLFLMRGHRKCKLNILQIFVIRISVIKFRVMCHLKGMFNRKRKQFFRAIQNNDLNQRPTDLNQRP